MEVAKLDFVIIFLFVLLQHGLAVDEESAKEMSCFEPKTVPIDPTWMASVKTWYYPEMSRLDLYRTTMDMTKKAAKDINEAEMYYDSCYEFTVNERGSFVGTGFGGKAVREFAMTPLDTTLEKMQFQGVDGGFTFTTFTTMTDNKSYIFMAVCTDEDQMHWGVISSEKALPKTTVKKIHDHALSLGFKKEHFTSIRMDGCGNQNNDNEMKFHRITRDA